MSWKVWEEISGITHDGPRTGWKKDRGKSNKLHGNLERDISLYVLEKNKYVCKRHALSSYQKKNMNIILAS